MRPSSFALACVYMLLLVTRPTQASLVYDIQNYPSDQNGNTVSGTITTDGTIGTLDNSNISSWVVTFNGTETYRSTDAGAFVSVQDLEATASSLTLSDSGFSVVLHLGVFKNGKEVNEFYCRNSFYTSPPEYSELYYLAYFDSQKLWETKTPSMGGNDNKPWVIAVAESTAVPEPSTLVMAGGASVCGFALALRRRHKWKGSD